MAPSRVIPHAAEAEEACVGSMLLTRPAVETALNLVRPEDFHDPKLSTIVSAITDLYHEGAAIDPTTVARRLAEGGSLDTVGGARALTNIQAATPASMHVESYAEIVARYASARRAIETGRTIADAARRVDLALVEELLREAPERIGAPGLAVEPAVPVHVFLDAEEAKEDWLVRQMLERGDRVLITGKEGGGKSVWLRQMAWQIAAGRHPWYGTAEPRRKVLHVDCENTKAQIARGYRRMARVYRDLPDLAIPLFIASRPQGLDLSARRDVSWLAALIDLHEAELVVIGPLYKLHRPAPDTGMGAENIAATVAGHFDELRAAYGCAVMIEAHAPHAERNDWRPFGSSLWLRWPEFGFGMKPGTKDSLQRTTVSIEKWRGMRDDTRVWPSSLTRNDSEAMLPWAIGGVPVE